jgi:FixJ family two-component response regulator
MTEEQVVATVYIVEDDASVRRAMSRLMRSAGLSEAAFANVKEFVAADIEDTNACVVADVRMPGASGLDLPEILAGRGNQLPVIFVTAQDTEVTRERARNVGAAGYFRKPVDDQALIDSIHWALSQSRSERK